MEWWMILIIVSLSYWAGYIIGHQDGHRHEKENQTDVTIQVIETYE